MNASLIEVNVADGHLLALARANQGQLPALDHKLATGVVPDGRSALALI